MTEFRWFCVSPRINEQPEFTYAQKNAASCTRKSAMWQGFDGFGFPNLIKEGDEEEK